MSREMLRCGQWFVRDLFGRAGLLNPPRLEGRRPRPTGML